MATMTDNSTSDKTSQTDTTNSNTDRTKKILLTILET